MKRLLVLLACASLFGGCATTSPASSETEVRAALNGFMDALNHLDVPRMSSYFAEDVTAFMPAAQGDRVEGRAAVTQIFQRFADRVRATTPDLGLKPENVEVMTSGDLAVVTFQIHDQPNMTRRRTTVYVRRDGKWLMRHMHASDFLAPAK